MATSVIGDLRVSLGLDSGALQAGFRNARAQLQGFSTDMARIAGGAAAALAGALGAMGVAAINSANDIQRLSRLANATPEQFQEWAAAAKSVGIEQDKLSDILKDVNDRVGDFMSTGGGEMKDFFEQIAPRVGVTAEMFRGLSGPDALQLYVDTLQKAGVNQQEFTFYMEAMADEATGLLPLLRDGGAGLEAYTQKARDLGAVMSDETVSSFAAAKRSLDDVGLAFTGFRNIIAAQVVPYIKSAADAFVNAARAGQPLGDFVRTFAEQLPRITTYVSTFVGFMGAKWAAAFAVARISTLSLAGAITTLTAAIARTGIGLLVVGAGELVFRFMELARSAGGIGNALSLMGDVARAVWTEIDQGAKALGHALKGVAWTIAASFVDAFKWIFDQWDNLVNSMLGPFNSLMDKIGADFRLQAANPISDALQGASDSLKGLADNSFSAAAAVAGGMDATRAALDALNISVEGTTTSTVTLNDTFKGMGVAAGAGAKEAKKEVDKVAENMKRVMKGVQDEFDRLKATMGMTDIDAAIWEKQREAGVSAESANGRLIDQQMRQIDNMTTLKDATEQWRDSVGSALSQFITQGGSFRNVLASIITSLADIAMSSAFRSVFQSSGIGGVASGILSGLGIGNNANGTPNWRGGLTWINERGGEIVDLPKGTKIIPHDISQRMADKAGGGGGMININVTGASGNAEVQRMVAAGIAQGIRTYDEQLPGRLGQINQNPDYR